MQRWKMRRSLCQFRIHRCCNNKHNLCTQFIYVCSASNYVPRWQLIVILETNTFYIFWSKTIYMLSITHLSFNAGMFFNKLQNIVTTTWTIYRHVTQCLTYIEIITQIVCIWEFQPYAIMHIHNYLAQFNINISTAITSTNYKLC